MGREQPCCVSDAATCAGIGHAWAQSLAPIHSSSHRWLRHRMGANREPLGGHQELLGESECVSVRTSELSCCLLSRRGHVSLVSHVERRPTPATPLPQNKLDRVRHASDLRSVRTRAIRYLIRITIRAIFSSLGKAPPSPKPGSHSLCEMAWSCDEAYAIEFLCGPHDKLIFVRGIVPCTSA